MYLQSNKISHINTGQQDKTLIPQNNKKIFNSAKKAYKKWNVTMTNVYKQQILPQRKKGLHL